MVLLLFSLHSRRRRKEEEEKEREDIPPNPPPGVKRQMRFRALDRVQAFKRGGNTFERLDHVMMERKKNCYVH